MGIEPGDGSIYFILAGLVDRLGVIPPEREQIVGNILVRIDYQVHVN
ncbi:MAG: hypothetical protein M0P11_09985 [Anaerolineaceae bacterium]|nr:hypothetical protein [Anaerolineaceae bacterium]